MSDNSVINIASNTIYIVIVFFIGVFLYLMGATFSAFSLEYITLPTTSFRAIGYIGESGIGVWILRLLDHLFRVVLLAVEFSIPASLVSCLFKQIDSKRLSIGLQIGAGVLFGVGMWLHLTSEGNYPPGIIPMIDIIFLLIVFSFFQYLIINRDNNVNRKLSAIFASGGVVVSIIAGLIIQLIALAIAVYAHVFSTLLDTWTYVDMTAGSEWNILHMILSLFSHFHNIVFFGGVSIVGLYVCFRVVSILVADKMAVRFVQSAIALWSLEFLLYAVTDEKSMRGAMFDTFDFSVLILLFALISFLATLGMFESINED